MADLKRAGWVLAALLAAGMVWKDPPPTWLIWVLLFVVAIEGYDRNKRNSRG